MSYRVSRSAKLRDRVRPIAGEIPKRRLSFPHLHSAH